MTHPSYDHYKEGITSLLEASEDYELAPLGISSLQKQAEKLAEFGRNGDIYVVHAAEGETVVPMEVLAANPQIKSLLFNQMEEMGLDPNRYVVGNEFNSLNPVTGMPEFFIKKIFKKAKKVFKKVKKLVKKIAPIAIPIAASFFGIPFLPAAFGAGTIGAAALGSGIGTLVGGGSLKDALKSAAIGGGLAGLGGFLKGGTAGLKASFTGQTPIFNPSTGMLIGYQAAATPSQVWGELTGDAGVVEGATKAFKGYGGTFNPVEGYTVPGANISPPLDPSLGSMNAMNIQSGSVTGLTPATNLPYDAVRYNPTGAPGPAQRAWEAVTGGPDASAVVSGVDGSTVSGTAPNTYADQYSKHYNALIANNVPPDAAAIAARDAVGAATAAVDKGPLLGSFSPSKLLGIPEGGSNLVDVGIGLAGTALAGGFKPAEEEKPRETADAARDVFDPIVIDPVLAEQSEIDVSTQIPTSTAEELLQPTIFSADGGSVQKMAVGGYPRRELLVEGPGTERSDDIPAMLSDGEFVINSRAVRGADPSGRGNRYAGANNLYNIMRNFEMRA